MKSKFLIVVATVLFLLLTACKKSNSNNGTGTDSKYKLKTYIEDASQSSLGLVDTFAVSYDGNNRITGLSSPLVSTLYTYSSNSFTVDVLENGQPSIHEIDYINSSSLVDSSFQYNDTNDSTTEKYIYSGTQLVTLKEYNYSKVSGSQIEAQDDYTYDNNGNVIKDVNSDGMGNINTLTTVTYTDMPLTLNLGPVYLPIISKYLQASKTVKDAFGNLQESVTFSYTFDSSGRVTQETDTIDDGEIIIKKYIYAN
ncbi:MAG: hypothetical protein JST87_00310 [Bacteroidetes bacterium]|nr:hypothetical protein [Bacteroidota bacterium]